MGSRPIENKLTSFDAENCAFGETKYKFNDRLTKFLADIFDYYAQFHPFSLSLLTHEKGSPGTLCGVRQKNERFREWSFLIR